MNISVNARSIVYEFLATDDLIKTISKLSKRDRKVLVTKDQDKIATRGKLSLKAKFITSQTLIFDQFKPSFDYLLKITNGLTLDFSKFERNMISCADWDKMGPILYAEEQAKLASAVVGVKKERQNEDLHFVINFTNFEKYERGSLRP
jgi:hypothetical protein